MVRELVKGIFDFTEEILKTQREFAQKILEETQGTVGRASRRTPEHHQGQGSHRAQSKTA